MFTTLSIHVQKRKATIISTSISERCKLQKEIQSIETLSGGFQQTIQENVHIITQENQKFIGKITP